MVERVHSHRGDDGDHQCIYVNGVEQRRLGAVCTVQLSTTFLLYLDLLKLCLDTTTVRPKGHYDQS